MTSQTITIFSKNNTGNTYIENATKDDSHDKDILFFDGLYKSTSNHLKSLGYYPYPKRNQLGAYVSKNCSDYVEPTIAIDMESNSK